MSGGEKAIYSDGESTTRETNSMYQLQDDWLGGCSNGDNIPDPYEPPNRVAIFMAETRAALCLTTIPAVTSSSTAAVAVGASGSARPPAQVLTELMEAFGDFDGDGDNHGYTRIP